MRSLPNHGTFVARVSIEDAIDAVRIRQLLEPEAIRVAFGRNPAALIASMRAALAAMAEAASTGKPAAYVAQHSAFHGAAYTLAASPLRAAIWARVEAPMRSLLRLREPGVPLVEAVDIHAELLSLLAEGDLDGALLEVARHLRTEEAWLRGESVRDARARTAVTTRAGIHTEA